MHSQNPPFASEVILYRTRTDILSDYRFIVNGATYPLDKIQSAQVVPVRYYIPLQVSRLLAVLAAAFLLLSVAGVVGEDLIPGGNALQLVAALIPGGFAALAGQAVPTHAIQLKLDKQQVNVMPSSDKEDLKFIALKVNEAAAKLKRPGGESRP